MGGSVLLAGTVSEGTGMMGGGMGLAAPPVSRVDIKREDAADTLLKSVK